MIRYSEAVLAGHPDKFCDQIADRIVAAAYEFDPNAYAQIEVAAWSDHIWLNGGIATNTPVSIDIKKIISTLGVDIGYCRDSQRYRLPGETEQDAKIREAKSTKNKNTSNYIDAERYQITDAICKTETDPTEWTRHVNDQCIVIGWAGYDEKVRFLPPEHFLAHSLREALDASFLLDGQLERQGPDGKLLVRLRENEHPHNCRHNTWEIEQILVTIQQRPETEFGELCEGVASVIESAYEKICSNDPRWRADWKDIELLVNPNGPLLNGGSDGDNGQTGRKLVMDYYGPRVPLGGGALSGKDLTHIDRTAAYAARKACVEAVAEGAGSCELLITYAPGRSTPTDARWTLDRSYQINRNPERFAHHHIRETTLKGATLSTLSEVAKGSHFFSKKPTWNSPG